MPKSSFLSQKIVRDLLDYDLETGVFRWKNRQKSSRKNTYAGKVAGTVKDGYVQIQVRYEFIKAHRLAFLWVTGSIPDEIDHKNLNRADNSWRNLRESNPAQNRANSPRRKDNTSGVKGVSWHKQGQAWRAKIFVKGESISLGCFKRKEDAADAYAKAAIKHYGEFARLE